jgi:hypothetical protein
MTYQNVPDGVRTTGQDLAGDTRSIGDLISGVADDFARLVRQQFELAKVEVKEQAVAAGRASAALGVAAVAGLMVLVLASFGLVYALAEIMPPGWAALIVAGIWALIGAVAFAVGRQRLRSVNVVPEKSVETVKEDMQWLRNPTS